MTKPSHTTTLVHAALYLVLGALGLSLAISPGYSSPIFPAAGLALALSIRFGSRGVLAVFLGSFALNFGLSLLNARELSDASVISILIAGGSAIQCTIGAALVKYLVKPGWEYLDNEKSIFNLLLVGGVMLAIVWGRRGDEQHGWEQTHGRLMTGVALGLLAALCQSVATLMLKPLMTTGIDAVAGSALRMTTALLAHGLLLATGWAGARAIAPMRLKDAALIFGSAAVAMALGMTLILQAMKHGQAGLVAVLSSVTPILILPLLWLIYRRRPAVGAWCGALLAVAGTAMILA
mgnify:CR=1 FL=1